MSSAPRLFLSALTREFGPARQRVANILIRPGYAPVWEGIFGVEPGNLRPILRANKDDCRGLIQQVGQNYGAEPPPTGRPTAPPLRAAESPFPDDPRPPPPLP